MDYVESVLELVGNTPMLRSEYLSKNGCDVFIKLEYYNPGGSIKDRTALGMIEQAEAKGLLKPGYQVIEASSGNMAIGLAMVCAVKGYPLTLVMPERVSEERRTLLRAYGANIVLTDDELGLVGAISEAENLALEERHVFVPNQFENTDGLDVHYQTTGPEIWEQMNGEIDIFVCGVGSAGTISGVSKYLKEQNEEIRIVAVEPKDSAVISAEKAQSHHFSGIGAGFVPRLLDKGLIDAVVKAPLDKSVISARKLAKHDQLLLGIASSAVLYAIRKCVKKCPNSRIVALGSSHGERYAGSFLYNTQKKNQLISFEQEI